MQEVITRCDVCREIAEPVVVALGRTERRVVVDLCPAHDAELVAPLRELVSAHGRQLVDPEPARPATPAKVPPGMPVPYLCLGCGVSSKSHAGISQHYKTHHGLGTTESVYGGLTCPLCKHTPTTAAALGSHAVAGHPEAANPPGPGASASGVHDLYRYADEQGDAHGVVAKARARLVELGAGTSSRGVAA